MDYLSFKFNKIERSKSIFFDRDGTLINSFIRKGKISSINRLNQLRYKNGVKYLNKIKKKYSYNFIMISNQPDLQRKLINLNFIRQTNLKLLQQIDIDHIYICPHDKNNKCLCRKPNSLILKNFIKYYKQNLSDSLFIGDREPDLLCAKKIGIKFILFKNIYNQHLIKKSWKTIDNYYLLEQILNEDI